MDLIERAWPRNRKQKLGLILGCPLLWIIYSTYGRKSYTCIFGGRKDDQWLGLITVKQRLMLKKKIAQQRLPIQEISQPFLHKLGHITNSCWWNMSRNEVCPIQIQVTTQIFLVLFLLPLAIWVGETLQNTQGLMRCQVQKAKDA